MKHYDLVFVPESRDGGFMNSHGELTNSNGIMTFHGITIDDVIKYISEFQPKKEHISLSESAYAKTHGDYGSIIRVPELLSEKDWPFKYVSNTKMVCEKKTIDKIKRYI